MSELFGQKWSTEKHKAQNVINMINAFNHFCRQVAAKILQEKRVKDRVQVVELFVQIAKVAPFPLPFSAFVFRGRDSNSLLPLFSFTASAAIK